MESASIEPCPDESPEQDSTEQQRSLKYYNNLRHACRNLRQMHNPPAHLSDWHVMCACQRRQHRLVNFRRMERAAARNCRLCTLFVQITRTVVDDHVSECPKCAATAIERTELLDALVVSGSDSDLDVWTLCGDKITFLAFVDDEGSPDFKVQGLAFPAGLLFDTDTSSDRTFRHAQRWLDRCVRDHGCSNTTTRQFPSRLLDVRQDPVHLIATTGDERPYVCLSHRWGGQRHRRLISTVTTIQSHMEGIPSDSIPKTFLDAIAVCRRLNMGYLWIDTLCILQSSSDLTESQINETKADFARENSAMASIYRNSHLTISADISTHMDSGLFSAGSMAKCFPVDTEDDAGQTRTVYVRKMIILHAAQPTELETRGWTFQEALLPPRVLCFGHFDIRWRCRQGHFCECGFLPDGARIWPASFHTDGQLPKSLDQTQDWWASVLYNYMTRSLTNAHDKLPALSGLARVYQEINPDTYMAGLWKKSLLHDLCWYNYAEFLERPPAVITGKRATVYRAPSWSWASIDPLFGVTCTFWYPGKYERHREYPVGDQQAVCVYLDSACRPKTSDPTGEVDVDCHIKLGVRLVSAVVAQSQKDYREPSLPWTITQVEDDSVVKHCMPDCCLADDQLGYGSRIYCAPVLEALSVEGSERGCLILKHLHDETYQRVGFCVLFERNVNHQWDDIVDESVPEWSIKDNESLEYAFKFDANDCDRITIL